MIKKILCTALISCALFSETEASHSNYSPMAPRQISVKASYADYSYGLSVLPGNSIDSFEYIGRNAFWKLNYVVLDRYLLRPVAHGYSKLPLFAKNSVHNFFSNISDLNNTVNNILVGEPVSSGVSLGRFSINSTIGLLGLIDVAKHLGLEQKSMSMNTVMGKAGADQGAFIMVPAYGPATERSLHASVADDWPYLFVTPWTSLACYVINGIDSRASLIPQEEAIDKAVDPYAQMRQIYLMYQEGRVNPDAAMENKADQNVDNYLDEIDD